MTDNQSVIQTLSTGGKRQRVQDAQIVTKISKGAKGLIGEVAAKEGVSEATIVRTALAEYFERRGYRG